MLLDAWNGLQNGTDAQKFASAARLVLGANEVARAMNDGKGFLESSAALGGLQGLKIARYAGAWADAANDSIFDHEHTFILAA